MSSAREDLPHSVGLLVLRLGLGGYLLTHGIGKMQMLLSGAEFGDPIGIGDRASLVLVVVSELVCALLVMIGLATRLSAAVVVVSMAVAAFVAHGPDPWTMGRGYELFMAGQAKSWGSKEPALLYLIPFLALAVAGAGRISLDALIWPPWKARRARPPAVAT